MVTNSSTSSTVRITDLGKLNLVKIRNGGVVLGSSKFPQQPQQPRKNDTYFKSGQNQIKNNHLAFLVYTRDTLCR